MSDERTSPELASLAGRGASMTDQEIAELAADHPDLIRRAFASLLTQAPDHIPPVDTTVSDRDPAGGENPADL